MITGPKKKAELVERAEAAYRIEWTVREAMASVVALVLAECESRVAPLVEALETIAERGAPLSEHVSKRALAAYRASLADEPEPKWTLKKTANDEGPLWRVDLGGVFQTALDGDLLESEARAMMDALAREREKRS